MTASSNAGATGHPSSDAGLPRQPAFVTTHWSVVVAAGRNDTTRARNALENLCRTYWYPLYAYTRRWGHSPEDAEDLTQDFFAKLIAKGFLEAADREKGRFRSFLLVMLKRFLANEWDRAHARKRGGGKPALSLDISAAEELYRIEPADTLTPDKVYDRRWALTLLQKTMTRLRDELAAEGRSAQFDNLKVFLTAERGANPYSELAASLGQSEGALRAAVHRMRKRFRELFREEIAHTVASPNDIEAELRDLMNALGD
jgi:RNA polymerase sigma factor (sigma-70 family)